MTEKSIDKLLSSTAVLVLHEHHIHTHVTTSHSNELKTVLLCHGAAAVLTGIVCGVDMASKATQSNNRTAITAAGGGGAGGGAGAAAAAAAANPGSTALQVVAAASSTTPKTSTTVDKSITEVFGDVAVCHSLEAPPQEWLTQLTDADATPATVLATLLKLQQHCASGGHRAIIALRCGSVPHCTTLYSISPRSYMLFWHNGNLCSWHLGAACRQTSRQGHAWQHCTGSVDTPAQPRY